MPDELFFSQERTIDLSGVYDNNKKKNETVKGLFEIFNRYKFTITENTPIEEDVALDPELLGRVFENLLASYNPETKTTARKQTGSFYTPREIVNYMVDESVKAYLKQKLETEAGMKPEDAVAGLEVLIGYNEKEHLFDKNQTDVLIKAIDACKILDPACGSGAFPMGILHRLVYILHKLDPQNKLWEERQIEKAMAIDDPKIRDSLIADIETAFRNNELDYGRKLYLIENCIYGVDIQPIATQISKLRFFILLVVDQKVDKTRDNFGIRPLPNLETKFVAANTLIGIEKPEGVLRNPKLDILEDKLKDVRHRLFSAKTPGNKRKLREEDQLLREKMSELLINCGWGQVSARQLAAWDPYDQNASSPFFDPEWMFGITDGFDVVIGNPPYGATYSAKEKVYFLKHYISAKTIPGKVKGSTDTFSIFTEFGCKVLRRMGNLHYILPLPITTSDAMTALHNLLEENCEIIKVSSYAVRPQPVFENAVVNTSIFFFTLTNTKNKHIFTTKLYRKSDNFDLQYLVDHLEFIDSKQFKLPGWYPKISYDIEKVILSKLFSFDTNIFSLSTPSGSPIYYRTTGGRYFKVITSYPTGSTQEKCIFFEKNIADVLGAILSTNLFFWYYQIYSDNFHIKSSELGNFSIPITKIDKSISKEISSVYSMYLKDIELNAIVRKTNKYANINSFKEYKIGKSKYLIDKIDDLICPLYGLTNEEIDFIKNYEIEYRLRDEDED